MKFLPFVEGLLDRVFFLCGAFIGSQIPLFIEQYKQRLSGHIEALALQLAELTKIAAASNKSLGQYIHKFKISLDADFVNQGYFMEGIVSRYQELQNVLQVLDQSPSWLQLIHFIRNINLDIAKSSLSAFTPGFLFSIEGLTYTAIGIIGGCLIYRLLKWAASICFFWPSKIKKRVISFRKNKVIN